jgi:cellulose biosynthesis protein BcsQ
VWVLLNAQHGCDSNREEAVVDFDPQANLTMSCGVENPAELPQVLVPLGNTS